VTAYTPPVSVQVGVDVCVASGTISYQCATEAEAEAIAEELWLVLYEIADDPVDRAYADGAADMVSDQGLSPVSLIRRPRT